MLFGFKKSYIWDMFAEKNIIEIALLTFCIGVSNIPVLFKHTDNTKPIKTHNHAEGSSL